MKRWVEAESEHKKKQPFDFTGWDVLAQEDCPQQHNGFDCGVRSASLWPLLISTQLDECACAQVFMCQFVKHVASSFDAVYPRFSQQNMPMIRWQMGAIAFCVFSSSALD